MVSQGWAGSGLVRSGVARMLGRGIARYSQVRCGKAC